MSNIKSEKRIVALMIALYCRKKHKNNSLCDRCKTLVEFTAERLDKCVYGEQKPACIDCKVHCYRTNEEMRSAIKTVMRYSGPRMLLYHPKDSFYHFLRKKKSV
jgi:hypothetical protein